MFDWLKDVDAIRHKPLGQLTLADLGELVFFIWLTAVVCWIGYHVLIVLLTKHRD